MAPRLRQRLAAWFRRAHSPSQITSSDSWSRLPAELAHEITAYNQDHIPTLTAMSLVSSAMRFSAILYLFVSVELSCPEDFHTWLDMLQRTPELGSTIVQRVTLSARRLRPRRGIVQGPDVHRAVDPKAMPRMPSVRAVAWSSSLPEDIAMAVPRLALFPNMTELQLTCAFPTIDSLSKFLGACGRLKVLALQEVTITSAGRIDKARPHSALFDLTGLEGLAIFSNSFHPDSANYIADLLEHSTPLQLKSLSLSGLIRRSSQCALAVEKLLKRSANSLENLVLDPEFGTQMFRSLPPLPALKSLRLGLAPESATDTPWPSAPNVTQLAFRIEFFEARDEELHYDLERFHSIMRTVFPQMNMLSANFPRFQQLTVHFSAQEMSSFQWDAALRSTAEDAVRAKVSGAGERLAFRWFRYGPYYKDEAVVYRSDGF